MLVALTGLVVTITFAVETGKSEDQRNQSLNNQEQLLARNEQQNTNLESILDSSRALQDLAVRENARQSMINAMVGLFQDPVDVKVINVMFTDAEFIKFVFRAYTFPNQAVPQKVMFALSKSAGGLGDNEFRAQPFGPSDSCIARFQHFRIMLYTQSDTGTPSELVVKLGFSNGPCPDGEYRVYFSVPPAIGVSMGMSTVPPASSFENPACSSDVVGYTVWEVDGKTYPVLGSCTGIWVWIMNAFKGNALFSIQTFNLTARV